MKQFLLVGATCMVLSSCSPQPEPVPELAGVTTQMPAEGETPMIEHVTVQQAKALYEHFSDLVVLDVRTPEAYNEGHIPGALNFNFDAPDFTNQIAQLNKNRPYLVHCTSGARSTNILDAFQMENFQMIYHLDGGLEAWRNEANPLVPSPK